MRDRMLIPFSEVNTYLKSIGKTVHGVLHVGAHECEEKEAYNNEGIADEMIYWVEGNHDKVVKMQEKGIPKLFESLILNEEKDVDFYVTRNLFNPGNTESSSILPFDLHQHYYPHVQVQEVKHLKTVTLKHLIEKESFPIERLNFWNLDIQGVELEALMSAGEYIRFADAIYVEVNLQHLYKGCALLPYLEEFLQGFGFRRVAIKMTEQGWGDALFVRI